MRKALLKIGLGLALLASLASCQDLGPLTADYFTVNPNPLEVKAGKVEGTITATFPEKYFAKNGVIEVTPVLVYEGGEATSAPSTYQGEKVVGNDEVIQYKAGGSVTQNFSFNYVPEMQNSKLVLRFKAMIKDEDVQIPEVEIAVGCIATATLFDPAAVKPAFAKDNFVRDTKEITEANIMFAIQQANVKTNDEVKALNAAVKATKTDSIRTVESLTLVSAASPDGGLKLNEKLAAAREKNTKNFLKRQKNQAAIDAKYIAQDWEGFQKLVQESSVKDKDLILRVLGNISDSELREKEIKNLSEAYKELATEILPKLRRSQLTLTVNVAGKTDEQILDLAKNNPDTLSLEELIFATTLAPTCEEKAAIIAKTAELNPTDWRTTNNLAASEYLQAAYADAKAELEKSVNNGGADKAEANFNLGLIALLNNDVDQASQYFGKAAGVAQLNEGQAALYIKQGEYAKAVSTFGNTTSNNAALAQLLAGNVEKAASILSNVEKKNANTYYLSAICAARNASDDAVISNLTEAIKLDSTLGKKAANDLEFAKYWTVEAFQAIAK